MTAPLFGETPEVGAVWMVALFLPGERPCATNACVVERVTEDGQFDLRAIGHVYEGERFTRPLSRMDYSIAACESDWRNRVPYKIGASR